MASIDWARVVDLARQLRETQGAHGNVDVDIAVRLVRAVVRFQEQMVGRFVRSTR